MCILKSLTVSDFFCKNVNSIFNTGSNFSFRAKVSYFFFPRKSTEPLTHSISRFAVFFFRIRKKIQSRNFRLLRYGPVNIGEPPPKWQKKWSCVLHFRKNTNSHHVIRFFCNEHGYRGFTICITFFRESRERERKIPLFSLTHPFLEIFILKVTFPGKKNTTPLFGLSKNRIYTFGRRKPSSGRFSK